MEIRLLKANEIECRIGTFKPTGMTLLLYKDARADMKILDETFGFDGWERKHELIDGKLFCTVSVWSEKRNCWISKQDVGTESNAEKEKGQASDSFKRACVNLGIGRELYTAPFIWIPANKGYDKYEKFSVKEIGYNQHKEIDKLVILDSKGNIAYKFGVNNSLMNKTGKTITNKVEKELISEEDKKELFMIAKDLETYTVKQILYSYGFDSSKDITKDKFKDVCETIKKTIENSKVGA